MSYFIFSYFIKTFNVPSFNVCIIEMLHYINYD
jgi:hypothetical protein